MSAFIKKRIKNFSIKKIEKEKSKKEQNKIKKVIFHVSFLRYSPFQGSSVKIFLTQNKFPFLYGILACYMEAGT